MVQITNELEENDCVIVIDGDIDASSSIVLDNAINEAIEKGFNKILVDCNRLNYISSAGLGVFMSYIQEFEAKGIQLVLFGLSDKVINVFQILGLDQLLNITDSKDKAKNLN